MHGESPWRRLRRLAHIAVEWSDDLPVHLCGYADFEADTIVLAKGMTQAERRSVCLHEILHLERRGVPGHLEAREERDIDRIAARTLIPFAALVDAMMWAADEWEIAEELTVSVDLVRVRLHDLSRVETDALNEALDAAEARLP